MEEEKNRQEDVAEAAGEDADLIATNSLVKNAINDVWDNVPESKHHLLKLFDLLKSRKTDHEDNEGCLGWEEKYKIESKKNEELNNKITRLRSCILRYGAISTPHLAIDCLTPNPPVPAMPQVLVRKRIRTMSTPIPSSRESEDISSPKRIRPSSPSMLPLLPFKTIE